MKHYDIVIIGAGPAGMAAAYGAYKTGVKSILVVDRNNQSGGILSQCLHDGFGLYLNEISMTGPEYADLWRNKLSDLEIEIHTNTTVLSISEKSPFVLDCISSKYGCESISADAVILATGCRERSLGAMRIPGSRPSGIYTAGSAQYMMNMQNLKPGKNIVILGSGDIGLIMARRFTLEGLRVKLVLGEKSSGLLRNHVQCIRDFGIPMIFGYTVVSIHGYSRLHGVTIAPIDENGNPDLSHKEYVRCDTLLVATGLIPETELWKTVNRDLSEYKGVPTDNAGKTPVEGIFACGNTVRVYDLVDMVSSEGEKTGISAGNWVLKCSGATVREVSQECRVSAVAAKGVEVYSLDDNQVVCTLCPTGCVITVDKNSVKGNNCKRGINFARDEIANPMRMVTTSVKINGGPRPLLPVKTDRAVLKNEVVKIMRFSKRVVVEAPVKTGDIIAENIAPGGVCLVATDTFERV